jgi:hypothetical protein
MDLVKTNGINRFNHALLASNNVGTPSALTVKAVEYGDGAHHITVLTLKNFVVGALASAAAALTLGNKLYLFPAGQHIKIASSFSDIVLKAAGTATAVDLGVGSVIAAGSPSALLSTEGATLEDVITGQTVNTAAAGGAAVSKIVAPTNGTLVGIALNDKTSVKELHLNAAATWHANNTGNLTVSGKIIFVWDTL